MFVGSATIHGAVCLRVDALVVRFPGALAAAHLEVAAAENHPELLVNPPAYRELTGELKRLGCCSRALIT